MPGQVEPSLFVVSSQPLDLHRHVAAADAGHVVRPRPAKAAVAFQQDVIAVIERGDHAAAAHVDDAPAEPAPIGPIRGRDRRPRCSTDRGRA